MREKFQTKRTSTGRPACVAEETWAIWDAYWDRPDVKAKPEQQRKNRMSEVEGPATSQLHQDAMKEMVNQQLETMRAEMEAKLQAERAEMEAKIQAERNQMQAQITSLMDELRRNGMLSTPMPPPANTQAEHYVNSNDENLGDY
nr:uncharacterized protein LOC109147304 [Ipomoea batatas]